jgi:HTH-type transcriptional regulator/antitoxin HigA
MNAAKKLINALKEDVKGSRQKVSPTYIALVQFFPLQPINSKSQHELASKIIGKLITHTSNEKHPDGGIELYLKTLAELVGDYEKTHFEAPKAGGAEMLAYLMELQGLNQTDLSDELGGQPVVSQILKGKRELNLRQVKALAKRFKVSPEVFIK